MRKITSSLLGLGLILGMAPASLAFTNSDIVGEYSCSSRSKDMAMETYMDVTFNMNGKAKADGMMSINDPSYQITFDFTYDYDFNVAGMEIDEKNINIIIDNGMFNGEPLPADMQQEFQDDMSGMEDTSSELIYVKEGILIYRGSDDVTTCIAYQG